MKLTLFNLILLHMFDYKIKVNDYVGSGTFKNIKCRYKRVLNWLNHSSIPDWMWMPFASGDVKC